MRILANHCRVNKKIVIERREHEEDIAICAESGGLENWREKKTSVEASEIFNSSTKIVLNYSFRNLFVRFLE